MTTWILVEKNLLQDQEEVIVHGIASVFCPPEYRWQGYAARHMTEIAKALCTWRSDQAQIAGSVLYSDIGKAFYANLGWQPNSTNWHVEFPPINISRSPLTQELVEDDLAELCKRDKAIIRAAMATPTGRVRKVLTILPDLDHMLWHIGKEIFATEWLFGKMPRAKGAIAGPQGNQVWAIWTHRYYGHPNAESPSNVLYILQLVVEGDNSANKPQSPGENGLQTAKQEKQVESLIAVLQHAQVEAAEWRLDHVKLWEPTPLVQDVITKSKINHCVVEREEDSIACGLWYDGKGGFGAAPVWINNEHYVWCWAFDAWDHTSWRVVGLLRIEEMSSQRWR